MRAAVWALLIVVAAAAAVLSFDALRGLALLCGFTPSLAWLLPVVIGAGAAAGCTVWLAPVRNWGDSPVGRPGHGHGAHDSARRFARTLTVVLLTSSVAGNAVVHGLSAYRLTAPWWLVVAVSAVAPAVLGAVVHLAVLVAQVHSAGPVVDAEPLDEQGEGDDTRRDWWADAPFADNTDGRVAELLAQGAGRRRLASELNISEHQARQLLAERNGAAR